MHAAEPSRTASPPTAPFSELLAAAEAGQFAVDREGGDAIVNALTEIQDAAYEIAERIPWVAVRTPLGGGYAETIGQLNKKFAIGDDASAQAILHKFRTVLEQARAVVEVAMRSYQEMEGAATTRLRADRR